MKKLRMTAALTVALVTMSACSSADLVTEQIKTAISHYCVASELERQVLRAKFSTTRGPLIVIHCENLEQGFGPYPGRSQPEALPSTAGGW